MSPKRFQHLLSMVKPLIEKKDTKCRKCILAAERLAFTLRFLATGDSQQSLTLSWRRLISYRNQSIDLLLKSMDWFLYDIGLRHERVNKGNKSEKHLCLPWKSRFLQKLETVLWIKHSEFLEAFFQIFCQTFL